MSEVDELRARVAEAVPGAVAEFDAMLAALGSEPAGPQLRMFLYRWRMHVALYGDAERAARLRRLEAAFDAAGTLTESRRVAAEIGRLLDEAAAEATR